TPSIASKMPRCRRGLFDAVTDKNASAIQRAALAEFESDARATIEECGNSLAEQYRMDVEADFVDHPGLQQRRGKVSAAHDDDVFSRPGLQIAHELAGIRRDQLNARARRF